MDLSLSSSSWNRVYTSSYSTASAAYQQHQNKMLSSAFWFLSFWFGSGYDGEKNPDPILFRIRPSIEIIFLFSIFFLSKIIYAKEWFFVVILWAYFCLTKINNQISDFLWFQFIFMSHYFSWFLVTRIQIPDTGG